MIKKKMKKKAFTLIELLVVISVIALLLSILMPSLKKVKLHAKRIICLSNLRNLATAWVMYADENNGKICQPKSTWVVDDSEWGWIDHCGPMDDREYQIQAVHDGMLWPYCQNLQIYRCPTSKPEEVIAYSIFMAMNGPWYLDMEGVETNLNRIIRPGTRAVFIDEGKLSADCFSLRSDAPDWWDMPPVRHDKGVTLSFGDTHIEFWKWKDERTIEIGEAYDAGLWDQLEPHQPDNEDLMKLQKAVWGFIRY